MSVLSEEPHYASDTKLGIGLVAAGNYLADRWDTSAIPSNVSLYSDISTAGFALLGLRGTHIFPSDRRRIDYNIFFYSFPTEFWGLDFGSQCNDDGKSSYRLLSYRASVTFMWRLGDNLFAVYALSFITMMPARHSVGAVAGSGYGHQHCRRRFQIAVRFARLTHQVGSRLAFCP